MKKIMFILVLCISFMPILTYAQEDSIAFDENRYIVCCLMYDSKPMMYVNGEGYVIFSMKERKYIQLDNEKEVDRYLNYNAKYRNIKREIKDGYGWKYNDLIESVKSETTNVLEHGILGRMINNNNIAKINHKNLFYKKKNKYEQQLIIGSVLMSVATVSVLGTTIYVDNYEMPSDYTQKQIDRKTKNLKNTKTVMYAVGGAMFIAGTILSVDAIKKNNQLLSVGINEIRYSYNF